MKRTLPILAACVVLAACSGKKEAAPEAAAPAPAPTDAPVASESGTPGSVTESTHRGMNMANMNMGGGDDVAAFTDPIDYIPEALGTYHWPDHNQQHPGAGLFRPGHAAALGIQCQRSGALNGRSPPARS